MHKASGSKLDSSTVKFVSLRNFDETCQQLNPHCDVVTD